MYGNHLTDRAAANDETAFVPFDSHPYEDLRTGHILALAQRRPFRHIIEKSRSLSLTTITEAVATEEHKLFKKRLLPLDESGGYPSKKLNYTNTLKSRHLTCHDLLGLAGLVGTASFIISFGPVLDFLKNLFRKRGKTKILRLRSVN